MTSAGLKKSEQLDLTPDQQRVADSAAARICVNAGPGSGKTRVLVERVANGVSTGRLSLDRVLALTFTENAAAQMKERLVKRFESPVDRRGVEQATISTIHGFCSGLLHEHAIEAGLDPRFRVLDEIEAGLLKDRVLNRLLDDFREDDPEGFDDFAQHFGPNWKVSLRKGCEEVSRRAADPADAKSLLSIRHSAGEIFNLVEKRLASLETAVKNDRTYRNVTAEVRDLVQRARQSRNLTHLEEARKAINLTKLRRREWNDGFKVLRGRDDDIKSLEDMPLDTLSVLSAALVEEAAAPHRRRIAELLAGFHQAYHAEKARLSALDFDDLERRAADLLSDPRHAASAAAPFQEILVDEYQDTSRLQAEILERMAARRTFFVVGDPKQSIYAFRNAEPRNFGEAWEKADAMDGRLPLREDFRSRPEILAAVNTYFSKIPGFGEPLLPTGRFAPKGEPSVEVLIVSEGRQNEAAHLARLVREKFSGRYGDVAMLFRSTTDMALYESALKDEGIPYFAETGRGFYDAREVSDVVNFLRVLDNDRDEVALATVLRSPMFGVTDDALYVLAARARAQNHTRLCDVLEEAEELPEDDRGRIARFRELFARLREDSTRRPSYSLVREVVAATGYEAILLRTRGGCRKVANLRKLAEVARSLGASVIGIDSLGALTRAIDQFRKSEIRVGEAQVPASEGGVRLMTMHAAKGLEFPVVILPDLGRQGKFETSEIDYLPEFGLGCLFRGELTLTMMNIRWANRARDEEEESRILFVAMTRAIDHLILSSSGDPKKNDEFQKMGRLSGILESFGLKALPARDALTTKSIGGKCPFDLTLRICTHPPARGIWETAGAVWSAREVKAPAAPPPPSEGQSDFAAAVTDVMEYASCPRRYYLGRYLGFAGQHSQGDEEAKGGASERGSAVHRVLAGDLSTSAEIEALARRFQESELGRRVASLKGVQREEPILGVIDGHFLRGVLDLRAGPLIVDYKTGKAATGRYRLQMLIYALLTGATEACLFYLDEGLTVPIELTAESLEEARGVIGQFFAAQRRLDFPAVVAGHCRQCPFSGRQCREPQKR